MASSNEKVLSVSLTLGERAAVCQALAVYRQTLIRSRAKEAPGSRIWSLRGEDIEYLGTLASKFQAIET